MRFRLLKALSPFAVLALALPLAARAEDTIKVGILHSLSGTMAISETALKETALMAIDELNAQGGVMGKKLVPVVVDPASNWPLFAEKARQLVSQDKVAVVFGCWTSASRKAVLPVVDDKIRSLEVHLQVPQPFGADRLETNATCEPSGDTAGELPPCTVRRRKSLSVPCGRSAVKFQVKGALTELPA